MSLESLAIRLKALQEKIILIYAFNSTGKTRLSVAYKDVTKEPESGRHTGVYYNAFSEDLFIWDNDEENSGEYTKLTIRQSSLNRFHSFLNEDIISDKLALYGPKYNFRLNFYSDTEEGIESVTFFIPDDEDRAIKVSRGEERIFVWCFFLALLEVEDFSEQHGSHIFIDDPVSSLDDNNMFVTAISILELFENQLERKKIIFTTHHIGIFSILCDWISKGDKASKFKRNNTNLYKLFVLNTNGEEFTLDSPNKNVFLYHLRVIQILEKARDEGLFTYHFSLLRQVLENIASFLGVGQFSYVLEQIGIEDKDKVAAIVNTLSHQRIYYHQSDMMVPDNKILFNDILDKLKDKYQFVLHEG